jgi:carboxymethylenebutenolidase
VKTIGRGAFVGASAAAFAATSAAGAAQDAALGKPHPPFVAENDPSIAISRITLPRPGASISAYVAAPKTITATTPGIVLVVHIWGVDAVLRDYARRFAKRGYIAIVPGLFDRINATPADGLGEKDIGPYAAIAKQMYAANTQDGDLDAARSWIRTQSARGKIGIYGNCMGGGIALQQLAGTTNYAAAAIAYGYVRADRKTTEPPPPGAFDWAATVTTPTIGSYAGNDSGIVPADVEAAYARMPGPHDVKIYPGTVHGFLDDTREQYDAAAATDAWTRMYAWLGKYLTTP